MDVFYCTNAINYTVACGVLTRAPRRAVLLYERRRFGVRPLPGVWQTRISGNPMRLLAAWLRLSGTLGTLYVPHHKVAKQFRSVLDGAPRIEFIDDGLDTLRASPGNIDLARFPAGQRYHSFDEYREVGAWLAGAELVRSASLADVLRTATQPRQDLSRHAHVFVESPGLDVPALVAARGLDPAAVLVVRHPVAHKRGPLPEGCATVVGNALDCEGSLLALRGHDVYCGETMAFFLLLHAGFARHNRLWLQMPEARWRTLAGLPAMRGIVLPGVAGRVAMLEPSPA